MTPKWLSERLTDVRECLCHGIYYIGWLSLKDRVCFTARRRCLNGPRLIIIPSFIFISELDQISYPFCDANDIFLYFPNSANNDLNILSLNQRFHHIYISINCRFYLCLNQNDIYQFIEIYKTAENFSLEINYSGYWNEKKGLQEFKNKLPSIFQKRNDFQQINLKMGLFQNRSNSINNSELYLLNYQMKVWNEISLYLNIRTTEVVSVSSFGDQFPNGSWTGIINELINGRIDMSASVLLTKERMNVVEYLRIFHSEKYFLFFLRPSSPILLANIVAYIRPFHITVWSTLFVVLLFISLCSCILYWFDGWNKSLPSLFAESLFSMNSIISMQGSSYTPFIKFKKSGRILIISTFILSIIIYQSYSTAIMSSLIIMDQILPFNDLQSLMDDGRYEITSYEGIIKLLKNKQDPLMDRLFRDYINHLTSFPEFGKGMKEMVKNPQMAFINLGTHGKMFMNENPNYDIISFPLINQASRLTFIIAKYSPYICFINQKIQNMIESGIIKRIMSHSLSRTRITKIQIYSSLDISMMLLPLSILLTGQILSIIVLIFEIIIFHILQMIRKSKQN